MKTKTGLFFAVCAIWVVLVFALFSCSSSQHIKCDAYGHTDVQWEDDINNPDNEEFLVEVAFNEGIDKEDVTQEMFNSRYGIK